MPLAVVTCHWPSSGALAYLLPQGLGMGSPEALAASDGVGTHPTATASR